MSLLIEIHDNDLQGFSAPAKDCLKDAVISYSTDLIKEANRIEAERNATTGTPEVTKGMVSDAKILLKRGLGTPKTKFGIKILRVAAALLSIATGAMYNDTKLQNGTYMLIFVLVITFTILTVTISIIRE